MKKTVLTFSFLLFVITCPAAFAAEQTGNCHCFRNRVYNPADRYAADDYLLTTVFNSLIAQYFSISKRQIVMMKMKGGVSNDDLLIGLYLSKCTGTEVNDLLAQKGKNPWPQVLSSIRIQVQTQGNCEQADQFIKGLPATEAAGKIILEMLRNRFTITDKALRSLREQGLSSREIALVLTLANHLQVEPEVIYTQYKKKGFSWSEIAHNFGLEPTEVGKLPGQSSAKQH